MLEQAEAETPVMSRGIEGRTERRAAGLDAVPRPPAPGVELPMAGLHRRVGSTG